MTVQHTNRVGKTYSLRQGKTKTGKPRWFFSPRSDGKGEAVDSVPAGYEIYEHPENAQVFLRKKRPQLITDLEQRLVQNRLSALRRSRRYRMDCKDELVTIYESTTDTDAIHGIFETLLDSVPLRPGVNMGDALNTLDRVTDRHYTRVLRFRLIDKERRKFTAERFCSRGSIDDWICLGGPDSLKTLADRYLELLGTDEFFDTLF